MGSLGDKLIKYCESDFYPFHMPGHKRNIDNNKSAYQYDITEIDGFDNLYEAEGILREGMKRAAECYGADETFYLVNGSTCGILTAIFSVTEDNDKILMARNCHGSVYKAAYLRKLEVQYIYPELIGEKSIYGSIDVNAVERILSEEGNIKAVVITSPTYEGVISDVKKIAEVVHKYNAILIVDEAHGSHLGFNDYFPKGALSCGADIVIQSLHKTMNGLTQTGLIHMKGSRVDRYDIKKYLGIFQTSSPSYILMESIDKNIFQLKEKGALLFNRYVDNLKKFRENVEKLTNISLFDVEKVEYSGIYALDRGKIVIFINSKLRDTKYLYDILRDKYHLQMEMVSEDYVLAMTSLSDSDEGFNRLYNALEEIDRDIRVSERNIGSVRIQPKSSNSINYESAVIKMKSSDTDSLEKEVIENEKAVGRISLEYIYLYPPGIPIIVPGEMITQNIMDIYTRSMEKGYNVYGPRYKDAGKIIVMKEDFKVLDFFRMEK